MMKLLPAGNGEALMLKSPCSSSCSAIGELASSVLRAPLFPVRRRRPRPAVARGQHHRAAANKYTYPSAKPHPDPPPGYSHFYSHEKLSRGPRRAVPSTPLRPPGRAPSRFSLSGTNRDRHAWPRLGPQPGPRPAGRVQAPQLPWRLLPFVPEEPASPDDRREPRGGTDASSDISADDRGAIPGAGRDADADSRCARGDFAFPCASGAVAGGGSGDEDVVAAALRGRARDICGLSAAGAGRDAGADGLCARGDLACPRSSRAVAISASAGGGSGSGGEDVGAAVE